MIGIMEPDIVINAEAGRQRRSIEYAMANEGRGEGEGQDRVAVFNRASTCCAKVGASWLAIYCRRSR
jgi:hypothetical protein